MLFYFQITTLNQNLKLAANFLQRCPSCLTNLARQICDFTCGANQTNFMEVRKLEKGDKDKGN